MIHFRILFLIYFIIISYPREINGFVLEKDTQKKLSDVIIKYNNANKTLTDINGYFSFPVDSGKGIITFSFSGYKDISLEIDTRYDDLTDLIIHMSPLSYVMQEIPVEGALNKETIIKPFEINFSQLKQIPGLLEPDPVRAMHSVPGIGFVSDLSNNLFVRGSNFDETVIYINDVPFFNPNHMGALFSAINSDIVEKEYIYLSDPPINNFSSIGGALKIVTRQGIRERFNASASLGILNSKLYLDVPFNNGNIIMGSRISNFNIIGSLLPELNIPYKMYDYFLKLKFYPFSNLLFEGSTYITRDSYDFSNENIVVNKKPGWGNNLINFNISYFLDHLKLTAGLYHTGTFAEGNHIKTITNEKPDSAIIKTDFYNTAYNIRAEYNRNNYFVETGLSFQRYNFNYKWNINNNLYRSTLQGNLTDILFDFAPEKFEFQKDMSLFQTYLNINYMFNPKLLLSGGIKYEKSGAFALFTPSFKIKYCFNNNWDISFSGGYYYQYLLVKKDIVTSSLFAPLNTYFPETDSKKIPSALHLTLGTSVTNILPDYDIKLEFYYKQRENIYTAYEQYAKTFLADGYSAGFDFSIKKQAGFITGWISYSFLRSIKKIPDGYTYSSYDRTHTIKIYTNIHISSKLNFSIQYIVATGTPYTPPQFKYYSELHPYGWDIIYGQINSARYSSYSRLDIGITGAFILWDKIIVRPYLNILNVFNTKNGIGVKETLNYNKNGENYKWDTPVLPTAGITLEF